jgi:plasmid stabilization system protein ParE
MKLWFTERSLENLTAIAGYLRTQSPNAAKRVQAAIYDSLQNLILFPHTGRPQKTGGVRKLVTRKYRYLVYYLVDDAAEEIIILSVKHPAQSREHDDA